MMEKKGDCFLINQLIAYCGHHYKIHTENLPFDPNDQHSDLMEVTVDFDAIYHQSSFALSLSDFFEKTSQFAVSQEPNIKVIFVALNSLPPEA